MKPAEPQVLYIDNHLLVINKPAPLATMGAEAGVATAVEWARSYLKHQFDKPGNVYVGVVSRLDAYVTGVLPLARTSKGASRLSQAFAEHRVQKFYCALVEGEVEPNADTWIDRLWHDDRAHRVRVVRDDRGQRAELRYRTIASVGTSTLLEIELLTGRKHQIRVQASSRGVPIVGDSKYGARLWSHPGIALHAATIIVPHPTRDELIRVDAPLPAYWPREAVQAWTAHRVDSWTI